MYAIRSYYVLAQRVIATSGGIPQYHLRGLARPVQRQLGDRGHRLGTYPGAVVAPRHVADRLVAGGSQADGGSLQVARDLSYNFV